MQLIQLKLAYRLSCNTYTRSIARLSVLSFSLVGNCGFVGLISVGKPEHRGFRFWLILTRGYRYVDRNRTNTKEVLLR